MGAKLGGGQLGTGCIERRRIPITIRQARWACRGICQTDNYCEWEAPQEKVLYAGIRTGAACGHDTPSHYSRYNPPCKTAKFLHCSVVFFLYSNWFSLLLRL